MTVSPRSRLTPGLLAATMVTLLVSLVATDIEAKMGARTAPRPMGRDYVLPHPGSRHTLDNHGTVSDLTWFKSRQREELLYPRYLYEQYLQGSLSPTLPSIKFHSETLILEASPEQPGETIAPEKSARQDQIETANSSRTEQDVAIRRLSPDTADPTGRTDASQLNHSLFDGLLPSEAEILRDRIDSDPLLSKINFETMRISTLMDLRQVERILAFMHRPLPGRVRLGLFLEPAAIGHDRVRKIDDAWGNRPRSEAPLPDDLDQYLQSHSGHTLIVAGHVVEKSFEIEIRPGETYLINIEDLTAKAEQHGVQLFSVGCETALAGAPIGFLHPISTEQLLEFVRRLPSENSRYGDVLAGYSQVGEFLVKPDAVGGGFELQVRPHSATDPQGRTEQVGTEKAGTAADRKAEPRPIAVIRIPHDIRDEDWLRQKESRHVSAPAPSEENIGSSANAGPPSPQETWGQQIWSRYWAHITAQAISLLVITGALHLLEKSHWANARRNRSALVRAAGKMKWTLVAVGAIEIAVVFYVDFLAGLAVVATFIAVIVLAMTPSPTQVAKRGLQ